MTFIKKMLWLLLIGFTFACQQQRPETPDELATPTANLPEVLLAGLDAHGGLEKWQSMRTLEYEILRADSTEHHLIDLQNRKVLLTHPNYQLGFDGQEVWVSPDKAAFGKGSARFYHNLVFYFHAMPFVLADPGINYEVLTQKELNGKVYNAIKISYDDGIGDAPEDYYIAHFDVETKQMEWLLYTVTYYSGEANERFNALHYSDWVEVNGLLVPKVTKGYKYADGKLGDMRYERVFNNIKLSTETPDQSLFEMPENAEIDSLRTN